MKNIMLKLVLLVLAAMLLAGCMQEPQKTEPATVPTTEAPTVLTTAPPVETTQPPVETTEPAKPEWLNEAAYLSYEEFFAEDRQYELFRYPHNEDYVHSQLCSWYIMEGNTGTEYELVLDNPIYATNATLYVCNKAQGTREMFYFSSKLHMYSLLACDGRYAYLSRQGDHPSWLVEVVRLDMATKTMETIVSAETIVDVHICGDTVMYFTQMTGDYIQICRMYLPEKKLDVLCSFEMLPALFSALERPASTFGEVTWAAITPEMQALLETELNNPDSIYRSFSGFQTELWNMEDPLHDPFAREAVRLLSGDIWFQTGVMYTYNGVYHCADGTVTKEEIVDEPLPEAAPPVLVQGDWQPLPGADIQGMPDAGKPEGEACSVILDNGFYPGNPWCYSSGTVQKLSDDIVTESVDGEDAVYCLTEGNSIIQLSWDGSIRNTLYAGGETKLEKLLYREGNLYVLEGSEILEIDVANAQYRVLIEQEGIRLMSLTNPDQEGLYFRAGGGYWAHIYWFSAEAIEETSA